MLSNLFFKSQRSVERKQKQQQQTITARSGSRGHFYPITCMNNYIMIAIMVIKAFYFQRQIASDVIETQSCYFIWQIFFYVLIKVRHHVIFNIILQLTKI